MSINPDDLRALADFLDEHPTLAAQSYLGCVYVFATPDTWQPALRELGSYEKDSDKNFLNATRKFGAIGLQVSIEKELTCERIEVGQREVEQEVYPDDVQSVVKKVLEPVYAWKCPESWLAVAS